VWRAASVLTTLFVNAIVKEKTHETASKRCGAHQRGPARLTELAEDVVGQGTEKLLTKNGASYVALVDAASWTTTRARGRARGTGAPPRRTGGLEDLQPDAS